MRGLPVGQNAAQPNFQYTHLKSCPPLGEDDDDDEDAPEHYFVQ